VVGIVGVCGVSPLAFPRVSLHGRSRPDRRGPGVFLNVDGLNADVLVAVPGYELRSSSTPSPGSTPRWRRK
jgi:hypothetical protein